MKSTRAAQNRGEFLLMLLVAVAIMGILAGVLAPVLANKLDDARIGAEADTLRTLRRDFEATYDAADYADLNEASLPDNGQPEGIAFTDFDQAVAIAARIYAASVTVDPAGWVTKLALRRGVGSLVPGASYAYASQNQYTAIAFNACRVQRCLVVGPTTEPGQQRYLLLSLMVPPDRVLAFPAADATQTFDSIWDQGWESTGAQAPAAWASLLSAAQYALWNAVSSGNRTNASRLIVERIVQPKYTVTLANNSPTDTAWLDIGPLSDAITAPPNAGTMQSSAVAGLGNGILCGRLIVLRRGATAASAYEVQRFFLYSDVNLTVQ